MLYYDRIDISKRIDPTRSNTVKEYTTFHYWFLVMGSNFKILYAMVTMI